MNRAGKVVAFLFAVFLLYTAAINLAKIAELRMAIASGGASPSGFTAEVGAGPGEYRVVVVERNLGLLAIVTQARLKLALFLARFLPEEVFGVRVALLNLVMFLACALPLPVYALALAVKATIRAFRRRLCPPGVPP